MKQTIPLSPEKKASTLLAFQNMDPIRVMNLRGVVLAGDIGGTKTNLSLYKVKNGELSPLLDKSFLTKEFPSFFAMYDSFKDGGLPHIDSICLGVAGPVTKGVVLGTNFQWRIDEKEIQENLAISSVKLINDMEANAYGLAVLRDEHLEEIKAGPGAPGNCALISPGTGLGEAGMFWNGMAHHPFATEGGHSDFCVRTDFDVAFWRYLKREFGHVSWERIISGPGIFRIYQFYIAFHKIEEPAWLKNQIIDGDPSAVISQSAQEGTYEACSATMRLFIRYLAIETAQMALKFKATGGIYLGGGILPKIKDLIDKEYFKEHFLQVNRMNPLLEIIPVNLILNSHTPIYGAAFHAAMQLK